MEHYITDRGFHLYKFKDRMWAICSIQKSSRAFEDCIWLWLDNVKAWYENWKEFITPKDIFISTRMEIDIETAKELVKKLNSFIESWDIKETDEEFFWRKIFSK